MQVLGKFIVSTLGTLALRLMTEDFFKWLILWASEKAVERTSFTWDNELHTKIKNTLES